MSRVSAQGVSGGKIALQAGDVQAPAFQIDGRQVPPYRFGYAQAVAEHQEE